MIAHECLWEIDGLVRIHFRCVWSGVAGAGTMGENSLEIKRIGQEFWQGRED